jgi:4-hydroxy-tetrahydrodipicolinate synthase
MTRRGPTRRQCLAIFASAAVAPRSWLGATVAQTPASVKPMRGAFMILSTPFTEAGAVDWEDLEREATFVDACGAHGLVWPQGSSEVASLTKEERFTGMEILARGSRGRKAALVLGVQGRDTDEMGEYARRAEVLAPDAMIAMPPSGATSLDDYRNYFRALGELTQRPVIIQTSGGAKGLTPPVELMIALAREFPHLGYAKEESEPLIERMKALVSHRPPMKSVFGASFGSGWLYERRLGLDGVITGNAMYADLMARIWEFHSRGQSVELRDAFSKFLLMRNISQQIPGADLYVMKKRGVFKRMTTRRGAAPGAGHARTITVSADEAAEIDDRFEALKPYLAARSQP